ncbi:hypothetical protein OTU49_002725, partial [Cherax quadricarinatus]
SDSNLTKYLHSTYKKASRKYFLSFEDQTNYCYKWWIRIQRKPASTNLCQDGRDTVSEEEEKSKSSEEVMISVESIDDENSVTENSDTDSESDNSDMDDSDTVDKGHQKG